MRPLSWCRGFPVSTAGEVSLCSTALASKMVIHPGGQLFHLAWPQRAQNSLRGQWIPEKLELWFWFYCTLGSPGGTLKLPMPLGARHTNEIRMVGHRSQVIPMSSKALGTIRCLRPSLCFWTSFQCVKILVFSLQLLCGHRPCFGFRNNFLYITSQLYFLAPVFPGNWWANLTSIPR